MTVQEQQAKLQELVQDEEYLKKLVSLGSAEAISEELEKEDIELSPDELRKLYELAKKKQNGELTDEELEEVAGGMDPFMIAGIVVAGIFLTVIGGLGIAADHGCFKKDK